MDCNFINTTKLSFIVQSKQKRQVNNMVQRIDYIMLLLTLLLLIVCTVPSQGFFTIQKAECLSMDLKHCYFKNCEMKTDAKGQTLMNFYIAFRDKRAVNDIIVNINAFRINKKHRMQIFNETFDFCAFMGKSSGAKMFGYIFQHFSKFTNANHSCPYQHDVLYTGVDKDRFLSEIPAPKGNYILEMRVANNQKWKVNVKIYAVQN